VKGALPVAVHELRQVFSDRMGVLWMLVLPVLFAIFIGVVTGGRSQTTPGDQKATLVVIDEDEGPIAEKLITHLETEKIDLTKMTREEYEAAEYKIRALTIPEGTSQTVLAGEKVTLELVKQPGTSEEAALVVQARIVGAIARIVGDLVILSVREDDVDESRPVTPEMLDGLEAAEDAVEVEASFAGRAVSPPTGFSQSVPGNIVMFVMLVALTYGAATLTAERAGGLLQRLVSAPLSRSEIIGGKVLSRFLVAMIQVTALVIVGYAGMSLAGLSLGGNILEIWLVLVFYSLTVAPFGVLVGAIF